MEVAVLTLDQRRSRHGDDLVPPLLDALAGPDLPAPPLLPFERTVGDEVQGVVDRADVAVAVVGRVLRTGDWNIGIGVGPVDQPLPASTREGRGTAYHRARDAVTRAKSAPHRLTVVGASEDDPDAEALETVLGLWAGVLERRTERGWEVHDLLLEGLTHAEAAQRLDISPSAVSQRAQAAGIVDETRARVLAERLWARLLEGAR